MTALAVPAIAAAIAVAFLATWMSDFARSGTWPSRTDEAFD